jgi:hypothetical protein
MSPSARALVAFSVVEDVAYAGLGIILAITAFGLLLSAFKNFVAALLAHSLGVQVVNLLDQILLVLLIIELLYTVQVSFREHGLVAQPFLVVGPYCRGSQDSGPHRGSSQTTTGWRAPFSSGPSRTGLARRHGGDTGWVADRLSKTRTQNWP